MLEKLDVGASDLNRNIGPIPESFKTGKFLVPRQQRFHNKDLVLITEGDPGVSRTVSACGANNEARVVPKTKKLPARPEGEVVTIALPSLLEFFGWHPVISHAEL